MKTTVRNVSSHLAAAVAGVVVALVVLAASRSLRAPRYTLHTAGNYGGEPCAWILDGASGRAWIVKGREVSPLLYRRSLSVVSLDGLDGQRSPCPIDDL